MPYSRRAFLTALGLTGVAAATVDVPAAAATIPGPTSYTPTWASIDQHPPAPEWFRDAKFGIWFHWGVFSVPAYDYEWYPRNMYIAGHKANAHHVATYGDPAAWPYHNFIDGARDKAGNVVQFAPRLTSAGGRFDPDEWVQLFVDAGARIAGPVAEHHDGFSMWDSRVNEWNSVAKGPRLDLLRLFTDAIRAKNLKLMVAMHQAYHINGFFDHVPAQSDPSLRKLYGQLPRTQAEQLWLDKLKEVIDRSRPDVLYQDFTLDRISEQQRLAALAYYYNQAVAWDTEVVATYKDGYNDRGEVFDYERGGPADIREPFWQTDDAISSSSWSFTTGMQYYPATAMLHALIDRVSKNGTMMLNISPTPEGTIPQGQRDRLLAIGDYLRRFGESIYATRAWSVYGEGPTAMGGGIFQQPRAGTARDVRYTRDKADTILYATVLGWPGDGARLRLATLSTGRTSLAGLRRVQLLGTTAGTYLDLPAWTQTAAGLEITMPARAPFTAPAYVVKLTFAERTPVPAPTAGAVVHPGAGYAGAGVRLPLGTYTVERLRAVGVAEDSVSSLRVAPGYRVTGYRDDDFTGTAWTFTADQPDLTPVGAAREISSLVVGLDPQVWWRLTNVVNGLVLDGRAGAALTLVTAADAASQWRAVELGDGYHRLVDRNTGMAVDGWGATSDGSPVRHATPNASFNQQWRITAEGGGQYLITNRGTGLVLDGGGEVSSGAPAKQWSSNGSPNLRWLLTAP